MNRGDFEHVIHASVDVVDDELVVVGSQAVLGPHPDAPIALLRSIELDVFPRTKTERSDEIDGALGDGSPFHEAHGYYAQGVGPETVKAPSGWEQRLIRVDVPPRGPKGRAAVAWCMETHDNVLAKLAAGRAKDHEFAEGAICEGLVKVEELRRRVKLMPTSHRRVTEERLGIVLARIRD